jgi:tetratricopeptide (TPR) repeat protein
MPWRRIFICLAFVAATAGAQTGALADQARESMAAGDKAVERNDHATATRHFTKALQLSRRLPEKTSWQIVEEALGKLIRVMALLPNSRSREVVSEREARLKDRVDLLARHPKDSGLRLGRALFDLESFYVIQKQLQAADAAATRAIEFYAKFSGRHPDCDRCDRDTADVEGILASGYFLARRYADAEPWLRRVIARKDEAVRPEVLRSCLGAQAQILMQRGEWEPAIAIQKRAQALPLP